MRIGLLEIVGYAHGAFFTENSAGEIQCIVPLCVLSGDTPADHPVVRIKCFFERRVDVTDDQVVRSAVLVEEHFHLQVRNRHVFEQVAVLGHVCQDFSLLGPAAGKEVNDQQQNRDDKCASAQQVTVLVEKIVGFPVNVGIAGQQVGGYAFADKCQVVDYRLRGFHRLERTRLAGKRFLKCQADMV